MNIGITERNIKGDIISSGIAIGTLCFIDFKINTVVPKKNISKKDVAIEMSKFEKEIKSATDELKESVDVLKKDSFFEEAEIVQAHILMLEDVEFRKKVHEKIKTNKLAAEIALEHVLQEMVTVLESSENMLFAQRADDLRDIGLRLRKRLSKEDTAIFSELLKGIGDPIIAARQLLPSAVIEAKARGIRAFITQQGSSLSHAAILAKSFGLPVLKVKDLHGLGIKNNTKVAVDAINGKVLIEPDKEEIDRIAILAKETEPLGEKLDLPVKLWINIVDPTQVDEKELNGIEGVGLYRSEFLFMNEREDFPSEGEQFATYSTLFSKCQKLPVTIRTLDIGGDKTLPYFSLGPQENPYLGFRAHRIYRFHPEIFITQVRAILRAGVKVSDLKILYPMVESIDDLLFVQELLGKAMLSLKNEGIKYRDNFKQGILLEVPSAVWNLKELLIHADFVSLGTNDLFQYFFAVDRNNANVYGSYQIENPVALQMLKSIVDIAKELHKPLNICGEIASDINLLPVLVGLGFDNLSIDLHSIPAVKKCLLSLNVSDCEILAQKCLRAKRTEDVKAILDDFNLPGQSTRISPFQNSTEFVDPICKMVVRPDEVNWKVTKDRKTHYFCCKVCKDKFLKSGG